jgi:cyclic beta-1,2-glucan synthetase
MMNPYIGLFFGGISLITAVSAFLWLVLARTARQRRLHVRDAALSEGELEAHAKTTALGHAVSSRRANPDWPLPRLNENYDAILATYKGLNEDIRKKRSVPPAAEWLLDNFYVLEEQVKGLRQDLRKRDFRRLPVLTAGTMKGFARIVAISVELVSHTDGQISESEINRFLCAYQTGGTLTDRELWALPTVLRLSLVENIRHLCETIQTTRTWWQKADDLTDAWLEHGVDDQIRATRLIQDTLKSGEEANPSFVEHLFFRLRRSGLSYAHLLRIMDESLMKYNTTTERLTQTEHGVQSLHTQSMGNAITSLHTLSSMDWSAVFEAASSVEQMLQTDPDGTYPLMDHPSRNHYRRRVEELAALHGVPELHIAREAIALAAGAPLQPDNVCSRHVGNYLFGKGLTALEERQAQQGFPQRGRRALSTHASGILYIGSIGLITLFLTAGAIAFAHLATGGKPVWLWMLSGLAVLVPASEIATGLVNWVVCKALKPAFFPRLEFKDGVPEACSTIVVVPTLLPDEDRVDELLRGLECHYLSNRDDNLYFALIGGFMDADRPNPKHDRAIVEAALSGVVALNRKYAGPGPDRFYYFQRENQFNKTNNKWIGWERKRGALMEFNELVQGSRETSFTYASHIDPPFGCVRYIITLDSDTLLPMGMARRMIGTMAHPLNRPVIDPVRGVVVAGYGLMQPRIDVELESSNRSHFSRIFTAQEGLDPYANAISDVYQDLFGEGIYTGKGIYDLDVFQKILKPAVPDNTILSHDLMEGSYVRTGLVTDLKLVDAHPSKYNSHAARQHRWVRGDWQLLPLLFSTILNSLLHRVRNPLSLLSRWKIFDNLRRSLVTPSLLLLAGLSFTILPGGILFWLGIFLLAQGVPLLTALAESLFTRKRGSAGIRKYMPTMIGMKAALLQRLLLLAFLPHQAWSMLVAITVTWTRVRITGKNLLQWVTSADVEKNQKNTPGAYLRMMVASPLSAMAILALSAVLRPETFLYALPLFCLWMLAPWLAYRISQDVKPKIITLPDGAHEELGRMARKTWRYFEEFADSRSHFLAPDNHQIDPPRGTAMRTSPTNIGLGLTAILTARDFGYVGTAEMMTLVEKAITTMEGMETWNGHLLNWYDTRTLQPLHPRYVSTVDSGNLACYLMVLAQGLQDHLHSPLVDATLTSGLRDTLACAGAPGQQVFETISSGLSLPGVGRVDLVQWASTLQRLTEGPWLEPLGGSVWRNKILHGLHRREWELREWMPALAWISELPEMLRESAGFAELPAFWHPLCRREKPPLACWNCRHCGWTLLRGSMP